jgi:predicted protein tyrosine phosphatase
MKIHVLSKHQFDELMKRNELSDKNIEREKDLWLISINDSVGTKEKPFFSKNHHNAIRFFFDDVDKNILIKKKGQKRGKLVKAFTERQGRTLFRFLKRISPNEKTQIIVHCSAGISRSGAIGEFCADYFKMKHSEFKKMNPHTHPNHRVLRLLNREYRKILFK